MPLRVVTWNVDGFRAMLQRRSETTLSIFEQLKADIVCVQETKLSKADLGKVHEVAVLPGWQSYFGLCRVRSGYAGVATFCKQPGVTVLAAEEGLSGHGADAGKSDGIHAPATSVWDRMPAAHLQHNDNEGRAVITDHGAFVLMNLYGPAVTDIAADRFPRKLTFYEAVQVRVDRLVADGRTVIIAGDLNIAKEPIDNCDWADSKLAPDKLLPAFLEDRPDRQWFVKFLDAGREGAPIDVLRRFHPGRRQAYTVWGRTGNKRLHNSGSRVDYILVAEGEALATCGDSGTTNTPGLLSRVTGCDIQQDWLGSDHAPVWIDIELDTGLSGTAEAVLLPKLESRSRFRKTAGGQTHLTSWLSGTPGKRKREPDTRSGTPPRPSLGAELAGAQPTD